MLTANQFVFALVGLCLLLYLVHALLLQGGRPDAEYFDEPDATDVPVGTEPVAEGDGGEGSSMLTYDLQAAINLSDVTVSDAQRTEYRDLHESAKQIPTVDERFQAAKRKTEEHAQTAAAAARLPAG
jgi:hypothetical protein